MTVSRWWFLGIAVFSPDNLVESDHSCRGVHREYALDLSAHAVVLERRLLDAVEHLGHVWKGLIISKANVVIFRAAYMLSRGQALLALTTKVSSSAPPFPGEGTSGSEAATVTIVSPGSVFLATRTWCRLCLNNGPLSFLKKQFHIISFFIFSNVFLLS